MFVLSPALRNIFHTPVAQCSLFVLKVPLNTRDVNKATGAKAKAPFLKAKACHSTPRLAKAMYPQGQAKSMATAGPGQ